MSCCLFWIQNGLWAIFGCETVLGVFYQTPGQVFILGVDFVLPLPEEQEEGQEEQKVEQEEQDEPPTKIYQRGKC